MTAYDKGDSAVLTVTFRTADGALTDPAIVKFRAVDPDGLITNWTYGVDAQVTKSSTGVYVATLLLPVVGVWGYHWTTEAGSVESGTLEVLALSTDRTAAEQQARARLVRMLSPELAPVLTEADIDDLMLQARSPDENDLVWSDEDWTPTWSTGSLWSVAAMGWEIRASRCFGDIDFAEDGQRFNMSQRFAQCMEMVKVYRRGSGGSGSVRVPSIVSNA